MKKIIGYGSVKRHSKKAISPQTSHLSQENGIIPTTVNSLMVLRANIPETTGIAIK
jgi:hypothetical protein